MKIFSERKPIIQSNILLAGPVRNVASIIEDEALLLRRSLSDFNEVFTLIVESDSTDDTISVLEKIKSSEQNFDFVSFGNLSKTYRKRTERIAKARNEVINQVKNNPRYKHIDFIAMADMDGMNPLLSANKIKQCWTVTEDWDVVTANQVEAYYDVWTLRHPDWSPGDCWAQKDRLQDLIGEPAAINLAITAKQSPLHPSLGMIQVDSAFGGFGIYKRSAFLAGQYAGLDKNGNEVSDHVPFHHQLREKNYRIYINCALLNCSKYPESQEPAPPPPLKSSLRLIQKLGRSILGKRRFNNYLEKLLSN
ncbi:hypothetical protein ICN35_10825 [Polynucleobacter sp. es-GGE-1]|uniref:hypothetical protein n=1 Tax=Polynucleobacter sp. es-GGE-1 TaxID=1819724 RepID=UPI001C0DC944|nr:hypothetical protein [Polynucleobacter sp. es-GGE-1]MBU3635951.1 hypothetical protein [Polynucleobacter sp. es-GGE-1]